MERHSAALPAAGHAPSLMKRVDPRILVCMGLLLFAASCFINVDMSPDTAMDQLMLPQLMRAAGQPLATIPLTQLSVVGLTRRDTADSAGITSVMRNLGASIGIANAVDRGAGARAGPFFGDRRGADSEQPAPCRSACRPLSRCSSARAPISPPPPSRRTAWSPSKVRLDATVMAYADSFWIAGRLHSAQPRHAPDPAQAAARRGYG